MSNLIFVYGSLRAGKHNHHVIDDAEFIQFDSITAKNVSAEPYFGIIDGTDKVDGEVYKVNKRTMKSVDYLEGISWGFYEKRKVTTHKGLEVWVYYANILPHWKMENLYGTY